MARNPDDATRGAEAGGARPAPGLDTVSSTADEHADAGFPIVAVGGSAGALPAFQELLSRLAVGARLALVIVSHQDPDRPSLLGEILAKSTPMPVTQVTEEIRAEPEHVYMAPPGRYLGLRDGVFHLEESMHRGHPPLAVDFFMRALAEDQGHRAVGIVLSGTGSDGTLGLAAIRGEGGLTLAQRPDQAEFSGMPGNAIAAGTVDLVLTPAEMAERLAAHAQNLVVLPAPVRETVRATDGLERVIELVSTHTGLDFTSYKRGTLQRRIERRLRLHGQRTLSEYIRFLEQHPEELDALWRDWLIGVSGFFRDPEAFKALEAALLDAVRERPDGSPFRVWVPGCAAGEEAYSIAILLLESAGKLGRRLDLQVFATDLDEAAIDLARAGRYPEGIASEVGPRRLQQFFVADDRHFVVRKDVRERVVFATQHLLRDPPFTRVDLISCRNVLIYLQNDAQKRILTLFHYSLNPGGLLFLGSSESLTGVEDLFSLVDRESKLFRRKETPRSQYSAADWPGRAFGAVPVRPPLPQVPERERIDLAEMLRRQLAEHYAPPGLIVDEQGHIEQIHGRTGDYLEPAPGRPNLNVLDMARQGLRAPLVSALHELAHSGLRTLERDVRMQTTAGPRQIRLRVAKLSDPRFTRPHFLVSFEAAEEEAALRPRPAPAREAETGTRVEQLEEELRATREDQHSAIEELQATNEELASANEEVQSVNEELQSANEELQTAREETQSLNEELQTVNAELRAKLSSLETANDDLRNLMESTGIAIIFVDDHLRVKRFTPAAQGLVPLIASDVGRPLCDISTSVEDPDLLQRAEEVLRTLQPSDREVHSRDGKWYSVEIRPYRTTRNTIEGISIAFVDVTRTKRAELAADVARAIEEDIVQAVREPFLVLDSGLHVVRANRSFYRAFGVAPEETEGRLIFSLGNGQWEIPRLRELLERILPENRSFDDFEVVHDFPGLGRRVMLLNARRVERTTATGQDLILLGIADVASEPGRTKKDSQGTS
jgi:two-component system CheB/CheR fusion protein